MVGIVSYGTYIPFYRIKTAEIAGAWRKDELDIVNHLRISEKSVPAIDEDAVTLAVEAAQQALTLVQVDKSKIQALFVGSESHPYAVNPTSTTVGELLDVGHEYLAADLQFACKAATAGIEALVGLVDSGRIKFGMSIGTDTAQSKPHDALEYTSGAGAVAMVIGKAPVLVKMLYMVSYSSDTPDFWRRDGIRFPSHAGRFSGEPAYFAHVQSAAEILFRKSKLSPGDFSHCIFHMPNGKFPRQAAKKLGFTSSQLEPSLVVENIGNPYSASALLGLAAVLDRAKPGELIFMVSYGSGAGSDGFIWQVTDNIRGFQKLRQKHKILLNDQIRKKFEIGYTEYLRLTHKI